MKTFPEDALPRLARPFDTFTPAEFFDHVLSLYEPRTSTGKVAIVMPKGKIIEKPTKGPKRPYGKFEIRYSTALGLRSRVIKFDRKNKLELGVEEIAKSIEAPLSLVKKLLEKKKFDLTEVMPSDNSE